MSEIGPDLFCLQTLGDGHWRYLPLFIYVIALILTDHFFSDMLLLVVSMEEANYVYSIYLALVVNVLKSGKEMAMRSHHVSYVVWQVVLSET